MPAFRALHSRHHVVDLFAVRFALSTAAQAIDLILRQRSHRAAGVLRRLGEWHRPARMPRADIWAFGVVRQDLNLLA